MTPEKLAQETYNLVLEIHQEWPEFKGAFLKLEKRVSVTEDKIVAMQITQRRSPYRSEPPPSRDALEQFATKTGSYKIPAHELDALLLDHTKAEKAARWDAAIRFIGKWALAVASTIGGAYVIHQLWK